MLGKFGDLSMYSIHISIARCSCNANRSPSRFITAHEVQADSESRWRKITNNGMRYNETWTTSTLLTEIKNSNCLQKEKPGLFISLPECQNDRASRPVNLVCLQSSIPSNPCFSYRVYLNPSTPSRISPVASAALFRRLKYQAMLRDMMMNRVILVNDP